MKRSFGIHLRGLAAATLILGMAITLSAISVVSKYIHSRTA